MTGKKKFHTESTLRSEEAEIDALIKANAAGNTDDPGTNPAPAQQQPTGADEPGTLDEPTQANAAPGQQSPPTPPEGEDETWKARYTVLKGKYDTEVPELARQVRELKHQNQAMLSGQAEIPALKSQIEALQRQLAEQGAPSSPAPTGSPSLTKLRLEYGDELVDGFLQVVREEIAPLSQKVDSAASQPKGSSFVDRITIDLAADGIRFAQYNKDDGFNTWLNDFEGNSAVPRRDELNAAVQAGDVMRSADFFRRYVAGLGAGRPDTSQNNPLEQHSQVRDGGAGTFPAQEAARTEKDALDAYMAASDDFIKGKVTREELERLEKAYYATQNRG